MTEGLERPVGETDHLAAAMADGLARATDAQAVILVEGHSDRLAVEALAVRRGVDLDAEGITVVPMAGATNIGHFLAVFGPRGRDVRLAGLCDAGEEPDFRRGLQSAGLARDLDRSGLARLGFHVCVADLEDELIRALGVVTVQRLVAEQGELRGFRTFQNQPAQRGRPAHAQLRRFLGTASGRKIRYARVLIDALDPAHVPAPLDRVLHASRTVEP